MAVLGADLDRLAERHHALVALRHDFHRHPEIAFEEVRTAERLSALLAGMGCRISRPIGGTGFVATLPGLSDAPGVALRTDMDALPQTETSGLAHASLSPGRMHACGHDGHMVLLLATCELLALGPALPGPVHFICQPAEETGRGAEAMIADGLFDLIDPVQIFGFHNWPGLPEGRMSSRAGPIMAAYRRVGYVVEGQGGHAAMPELASDMFGVVARLVDETAAAVRSLTGAASAFAFTELSGSVAANIIPDRLDLSASFRFVDPAHAAAVEAILSRIARAAAAEFGVAVRPHSDRMFDMTVNDPAAVALASTAAAGGPLVWEDAPAPAMVSEDFGTMIAERPGCYLWLGAGMDRGGLHNSRFDFNDRLLLTAPACLAALIRQALGPGGRAG